MDLLTQHFGTAQEYAIMVFGVLFVFTVVVFIHELGHFLVARWCGVAISAFSIGFGPEIFGFTDRHGTRWRFAWIPLGGYVKFIDDDNPASAPSSEGLAKLSPSERENSFRSKTVGQRAAIVAAGPIANFLLAIFVFAFMFALIGQPITTPKIDEVVADSAAAAAGLEPGDIVVSIDGSKIESFTDLQRIVMSSADRELTLVVDRGGDLVTLKATPRRKESVDRFGNKFRIGLLGIKRSMTPEDLKYRRYDPISAVAKGTEETYFIITRTLSYLGDVVVGREDVDQLGGPIKIAQIAGQAASVSFGFLLKVAALISISLGLINLFPIPILDGGHLLFYGIEAIRGQPLSEKTQEIGFRIGLALILMLMVMVTWNDLVQLLSRSS